MQKTAILTEYGIDYTIDANNIKIDEGEISFSVLGERYTQKIYKQTTIEIKGSKITTYSIDEEFKTTIEIKEHRAKKILIL